MTCIHAVSSGEKFRFRREEKRLCSARFSINDMCSYQKPGAIALPRMNGRVCVCIEGGGVVCGKGPFATSPVLCSFNRYSCSLQCVVWFFPLFARDLTSPLPRRYQNRSIATMVEENTYSSAQKYGMNLSLCQCMANRCVFPRTGYSGL